MVQNCLNHRLFLLKSKMTTVKSHVTPDKSFQSTANEDVAKFIRSAKLWLTSHDSLIIEAGSRTFSSVLEKVLVKRHKNAVNLFFCILEELLNSGLCKVNSASQYLSVLNQILAPCARSAWFKQNGCTNEQTKLGLLGEVRKSVFQFEVTREPAIFKCLTSLLTINHKILDSDLDKVWSMGWLRNSIEKPCKEHVEFLSALLKTYTELQQLPKLFLQLTSATKDNRNSEKESLHPVCNFPRFFLLQFSDSVVSLPLGQSLQLWQILLSGIKELFEDQSNNFQNLRSLVNLFCSLLTHIKISDSTIPLVKMKEVNKLMEETRALIKELNENHCAYALEILLLCYAWGEAQIVLKSHEEQFKNSTASTVETEGNNHVFDLTNLHDYLTAEEWITFMNNALWKPTKTKQHIVVLLQIQKVRCLYLFAANLRDVSLLVQPILTYIIECLVNEGQGSSSIQFSMSLWESVVTWLPLLIPNASCKQLQTICQIMIDTLKHDNSKAKTQISQSFLKSSFFAESRIFQTNLITCIWSECKTITRAKRKHDESSTQRNGIFESLSKNSKMWNKICRGAENEITKQSNWGLLEKISREFVNGNLNCNGSVDVEKALRLMQSFCFFPLENMELANQLRCFIGMLHILFLLKSSKHEHKSELHILLCQLLISLLSKNDNSVLLVISDPCALLKDMFHISNCCAEPSEEHWSFMVLDRILQIIISQESALSNVWQYVMQFHSDTASSSLELKFLQVVTKRMVLFLNKHAKSNSSDTVETCNKATQSFVSILSKNLESFADLSDDKLTWQCLTCILSYHLKHITLELKQKPKTIIRKHKHILQKLMKYKPSEDADTNEEYYRIVIMICTNRKLFEKQLPENLIQTVWNNNMPSMVTDAAKQNTSASQIELLAFSALLKCLKPTERKDLFKDFLVQLGKFCFGPNIPKYVLFWSKIMETEFVKEMPQENVGNVIDVLKFFLPFVVQLSDNPEMTKNVVLPILNFMAMLLYKNEVSLRHGQVLLCLHACCGLKLSSLEPTFFLPVCDALFTIYRRMITNKADVILQAVAPFISCLNAILRCLICAGHQTTFLQSNENVRKSLVNSSQDLSKLLALVAKCKTEFNKQAGFIIAEYVNEIQKVTLHTMIKEPLTLGICKLMDICDKHAIEMLQVTLGNAGQEILKQLHQDFKQHYHYKGTV